MQSVADQKLEMARDPNTKPELLTFVLPHYPEEVLANPALPLLLLEDPATWGLQKRRAHFFIAYNRLNAGLTGASDAEKRLFAADCAERVLWLFEGSSDSEKPRNAILAARGYALGEVTREALVAAHKAVGCARYYFRLRRCEGGGWAARAAHQASPSTYINANAATSARCAIRDTVAAVQRISVSEAEFAEASLREVEWQAARLAEIRAGARPAWPSEIPYYFGPQRRLIFGEPQPELGGGI